MNYRKQKLYTPYTAIRFTKRKSIKQKAEELFNKAFEFIVAVLAVYGFLELLIRLY